jgi:hypothetical protein
MSIVAVDGSGLLKREMKSTIRCSGCRAISLPIIRTSSNLATARFQPGRVWMIIFCQLTVIVIWLGNFIV